MRIQGFLKTSALFQLSVTYDEVMGDFQKKLKTENVHFLEALILTGLFFEERDVRPTELAKTYLSSKSNMSHALRGLEKAGLVLRKTSEADARAYLFGLTKEGKKKSLRLIKILDRAQDKIERTPGSKRIQSGLALLRRAYANLTP